MTMNTWIPHLNPLAAAWQAAIWRATWQGSLALLLVWAVCRVFHRLPARAKSWLWRLAYLKLLVALLLAAPIDLPLLPAKAAPPSLPAQVADSIPLLPPLDLPSPAFSVPAQAATTPATPGATAVPRAIPRPSSSAAPVRILSNVAAWLLIVWAFGVAAFGVRAWRGSRCARRLLCAGSPVANASLRQCAAELARSFRLAAAPSLLMSGDISSPLLLGIRRPVIILPSVLVSGSRLSNMRLMIAHEMAHIKRLDLGWVWLAVAGEGLFFFHPLLWLARREWRLAQEMACDEMVVRMTRVPAAAYGEMLVGVAALNLLNCREPFLVTMGLTETKEMLAKRLNAMKLIKSNSTKRMVLATAAILTVSALSVLPWRLTAQESSASVGASAGAPLPVAATVQTTSNVLPQAEAAPEPAPRQFLEAVALAQKTWQTEAAPEPAPRQGGATFGSNGGGGFPAEEALLPHPWRLQATMLLPEVSTLMQTMSGWSSLITLQRMLLPPVSRRPFMSLKFRKIASPISTPPSSNPPPRLPSRWLAPWRPLALPRFSIRWIKPSTSMAKESPLAPRSRW